MWISGVGSDDMNHSWLVVLQIQHSGQMNSMRCFSGGDNEARLRLMSRRYARSAVWSGRWDLNHTQSPTRIGFLAGSHGGGLPPRVLSTKGEHPFRNPLVVASNPARERVWSGRWDLNPRQLAWEARTLPLSYARSFKPAGILRWH